MAASTVATVKQGVIDLLVAIPALNEVAVSWGEPTEEEDLRDELIYFRDPVTRSPNWGPLGGMPIDEEYTLVLVVRNRLVGDDQASAETRAWELLYEVDQVLRGERLGVLLKPIDFGDQELTTHPLSDGWYGEIVVPLVCTARI